MKPHFLFMRFHGLLLVVPELCVCLCTCVCVCVCVCACVQATSNPPEAITHILHSVNSISPHTGKEETRACLCVGGVSVYGCTHTHTHTHTHTYMSIYSKMFMRVGGG